MFAYFQEFVVPDTGERLVRKGFIALGAGGRVLRQASSSATSRRSPVPRRTAWNC